MTEDLSEEQVTRLQASIPIGRLGEAEDVAAAVVYLASSEASYVTGATLNVNWYGYALMALNYTLIQIL